LLINFLGQVMASRRETEQSKSKEAVEEVLQNSKKMANIIWFFGFRFQVETREEQNKKWEETRAGRVDSWRNWTNGKRTGCVCAYSLPESDNLNFPHCSGPTFIRPPKIQKEEHTRQV
jgi:hypothetical protein